MMRGTQAADAFAEEEQVAARGAERAAHALALVGEPEEADTAVSLHERILLGGLLLVATAWLAALAWIALGDPAAPPLTPAIFAKGVATASSPLVLIGVALLLLLRTSRRETRRFARMAAVVRAEAIGLNTALSLVSRRLEQDRAALAETAATLMALGDDSSQRLAVAHGALGEETSALAALAKQLDGSAAAARIDMGVLLADLPRADAQLRDLAEALRRAASDAETQAETLAPRITALGGLARDSTAATDVAVARMDAAIEGVLARTADGIERTREGVTAQGQALLTIEARLTAMRGEAEALAETISKSDRAAMDLAEGAAPRLIEALARVRETAAHAAERARETLATVIPASTAGLADKMHAALDASFGAEVEAQLARVASATEAALAAARRAAGAIGQQMGAIDAASGALDERFAKFETGEGGGNETFARRAALLVEALNSAAIDIGKAFASDVGDPAWDAYLKGDRSVFTRRTLKLLEAGDAREVTRRYEEDPVFHDQVARYVHDFETMLRPVLAARDGAAFGVTLLSSDMGKLYVALAQATARLRA